MITLRTKARSGSRQDFRFAGRLSRMLKLVSNSASIMIACLFFACTAQAQDKPGVNYESYNGFTCDPVPKLPAKEVHPSLWFTADEAATMRAKKHQDEQAARLWNAVAESKFLTLDLMPVVSATDEKKPIHQYYGYMSQMAKYSGFMIWMTEDETQKKKWIARTTALLERAYDGPVYELDPKEKGGPTDEIYLGS